jgi:hypothetical protein
MNMDGTANAAGIVSVIAVMQAAIARLALFLTEALLERAVVRVVRTLRYRSWRPFVGDLGKLARGASKRPTSPVQDLMPRYVLFAFNVKRPHGHWLFIKDAENSL